MFSCLILTGIGGCNSSRFEVNISDIDLELHVQHFEKDLFKLNPDSLIYQVPEVSEKYDDFFIIYNTHLIGDGKYQEDIDLGNLRSFLSDADIQKVYIDCRNLFTDFTVYKTELEEAFKRYHYFFPDSSIPDIITYISGFNYKLIVLDSTLGIGLDMYLGKEYELYRFLPFYKYIKERMTPEHLVTEAVFSWISTEFVFNGTKEDLLNIMIYEGKLLFLLDVLLPEKSENIKMGYSQEQMQWCYDNEGMVWAYFIDNELLFTTNYRDFYPKYIQDAPFTSGMPHESPGRLGIWLGARIVKSYMENNKSSSLQELLNENNAQKILSMSGYKPKMI